MKNTLSLLCIKIIIFNISIVLLILPFAIIIHDYKSKYEPRSSLFNNVEMKDYPYALIGDSVFCSHYVNNDTETIWNTFESITGRKMFPGALDAMRNVDLVNAAKYLSNKMQPNSTVFIDIHPARFMIIDQNRSNHREQQFADLFQIDKDKLLIYKYFNYLDVRYLDYIQKYLSGKKSDLNDKVHFNRVWNINGDFAISRFTKLLSEKHQLASDDNLHTLSDINNIFKDKCIYTVFVLTPLNKEQIYTYMDIVNADKTYSQIKDINKKTKEYLNRINASTIDLFESVPTNCFADLVHTNTCGDEIIAKSLAEYALNTKRHQR